MNMLLFCTAFILQFVGHRIGDYLLQTDWQASNKAVIGIARSRHCFSYSAVIGALMLFVLPWQGAAVVFALTFLEHMYIDTRKPVVRWKMFLENRIARRRNFEIDKMPLFVLIEIDQSIHYLRIFLISLLIAYGIV